jgi:flagellar protein FliS
MNAPGLSAYTQTNIESIVHEATPHKLIEMLFKGAKDALAQAMGAIERKDFEGKSKKISKATEIILNLQTYLDQEKGGEIAENLNELYTYMAKVLIDANRTNDLEKLREVSGLLETVADGWASMAEEFKQ